jgi:hypothetical protein
MTDGGHIVVCGGIDKPQSYVDDGAFQNKLGRQIGNVFGCRTGYLTNYHRKDQLAESGKPRAEEIAYHYGQMPAVIRQKFAQKAFLFLFFHVFAPFFDFIKFYHIFHFKSSAICHFSRIYNIQFSIVLMWGAYVQSRVEM